MRGNGIHCGSTTVIRKHVDIGDYVSIGEFCELGVPSSKECLPLCINKESIIRSHSVLYEGSVLGEKVSTGHHVLIRENTTIGDGSQIGSSTIIEGNAIIRDYVRMQSGCQISPSTQIGSYTWIFPAVQFTNDPMPPSSIVSGIIVEDMVVIGTKVLILPGVRLGMGCFVTAGSVVKENVEPCMVVGGNPAKPLFPVSKLFKDTIYFVDWPIRHRNAYPQKTWDRLKELTIERNRILDNM